MDFKAMFEKVVYLDAQVNSNDIPKEAYDELRDLWATNELGNDTEYFNWEWEGMIGDGDDHYINKYFNLAKFLKEQLVKEGYPEDQSIMIHWWW